MVMHLLECHKLTRHFGSLEALSDVDMKIEAGEVRAVIGPNGAGKSTLFNAVNGVFAPTRGYCLFNNINITNFPMHKIVKSGISRTFQLTHLFPELTVIENICIASQAKLPGAWLPMGGQNVLSRAKEQAEIALEKLKLNSFAHLQANTLSHGDQRLLEIAMAISQQPLLLMLDEPTQGLSVEETEATVNILKNLLNEGDLTVILVEHDMDVVFNLAQKITVLHQGRVIADGDPDDIKANKAVQNAYLGGFEDA